MSHTFFISP